MSATARCATDSKLGIFSFHPYECAHRSDFTKHLSFRLGDCTEALLLKLDSRREYLQSLQDKLLGEMIRFTVE